MLFGGLAILSQQYEWAERRLDPIKYRALKGAAEGVETWLRIVAVGAGRAGADRVRLPLDLEPAGP